MCNRIFCEGRLKSGWYSPQTWSTVLGWCTVRNTYVWCTAIKDSCEIANDLPHVAWLQTSVSHVNTNKIQKLTVDNCHISVHKISQKVNNSVGSVDNIIPGNLHLWKVSVKWVPKILTFNQKDWRAEISSVCLEVKGAKCISWPDCNVWQEMGPSLHLTAKEYAWYGIMQTLHCQKF